MTDENSITTKAKFLCNLCDCVSIGNKGDTTVQSVFSQFNYANCYTSRVATKKALPGTVQIKGDGKKNRFVVNMFVQFYPGAPKYPNDNIVKRLEWFVACLEKLLEIPDAHSFAFPIELGIYETANYADRYTNLIDDFKKKYYLRHTKIIKIVDYEDDEFFSESTQEEESVKYDKPIESVNMENLVDIDQIDLSEDDENPLPAIKVIRKIDLNKLKYLSEQSATKTSTDNQMETQSKIKIGLKKAEPKPLTTPKITIPNKQATTNLQSKFNSVEHHDESLPKLTKNLLADDTDDEPIKKAPPKKTIKTKQPIETKKPIETKNPVEIKATTSIEQKPEQTVIVPESMSSSKIYDKNPHWKKSISELAAEVDEAWDPILKDPKVMAILDQLDKDFDKELEAFGDHVEILPSPQELVFNAFKQCQYPPKGVIVGQDPYFSNLNEAMGLSFSVPKGVKYPPTLTNIFTELSTDISGFTIPKSGDLTKWAKQDILLLNTALTVRYKQKESHLKQWKAFTDTVIQLIAQKAEKAVVFMLWGNPAKAKKKLIPSDKIKNGKVLVLEATHPSPLGANQGGWFGCKHFSQCNEFLQKNKLTAIDWKLD